VSIYSKLKQSAKILILEGGVTERKSETVMYKMVPLDATEADALFLIGKETKWSIGVVDVIEESRYNEIKVIIKDYHIVAFSSIGFNFTAEIVKKFIKLESLRLRWNQLTTIPDYITDMKLLKLLDLRYN